MKTITFETKSFISNIIGQETAALGHPPEPFAVFSMGSLAREESGFYTDLEIGYLVPANTVAMQKYLAMLSQRLADRFFLLGEHPDVGGKGFRMDEADNSPLHYKFKDRYSSPQEAQARLLKGIQDRDFASLPTEGSRVLITTPQDLAGYLRPDALKRLAHLSRADQRGLVEAVYADERDNPENQGKPEKQLKAEISHWVQLIAKDPSIREKNHILGLAGLLRNSVFLHGTQDLFDSFTASRTQVLNGPPEENLPMVRNRRQEIAYKEMKKEVKKYVGDKDSFVNTGKLGETIDLKRQLYRLGEQILTNLGFYYGSPRQNTMEIVDFLLAKGVFNQRMADRTREFMNGAMGLRLQKQYVLRKQGYAIYLDQSEFEKDLKKLEVKLANLEAVLELDKQLHEDQETLAKVQAEIFQIQHKIEEHKKVAPGAILGSAEVERIESTYIPELQELFQATREWVLGNGDAYQR